jgi:hypothetical protein
VADYWGHREFTVSTVPDLQKRGLLLPVAVRYAGGGAGGTSPPKVHVLISELPPETML